VAETQKQVAAYVVTIREVNASLDPVTDRCAKRKQTFGALARQLLADADPICQQMGRVMASFQPGLFAGGDRGGWPGDNLDLEHERRITAVVMPECELFKRARR